MFKSKFSQFFFVIAFSSIFCSLVSSALGGGDDQTVQNGIHHFTSNLIQVLHQRNIKNESILFSPINSYAALLLLHLGSDSTTRDEIIDILKISKPETWPGIHENFGQLFEPLTNSPDVKMNEEYHLNLTDVIFVDRIKFKKKFVGLARSYYDSNIIQVNFLHKEFEAINIMNKYIANRIENSVPQFYSYIEPETPYSKVILTSCLHFKSWWKFSFRKSATQSDTFHSANGPVKVDMMQRVGYTSYANLPWLSSEVACLTANPNISVFIILPYKELGLRYLLNNLDSDDFNRVVNDVLETRRVDFKLPRITLQWSKYFDEALYDLGARKIFTPQANFQPMTSNTNLDVREVKYVADIKITEYEIEVSSVTGVKISSSLVDEPSSGEISYQRGSYEEDNENTMEKFADLEFYVNRPFFMFVYRNDIKSVMFLAAINDPTQVMAEK